MKINILELIDFEEVNKLLEGFNQTTGFVTAIVDLEGNVLSKSGWRQICTEFHRIHPETANNCRISDTTLANESGEGEKYHYYQCRNGLIDVAVPIVINGEHIANLFSGQFFFREPDQAFFKKQAETYGFKVTEYLKALGEVPIVSKEKVNTAMDFLLNMTQLISGVTFQKTEQLQLNEALRINEARSRNVLDQMLEGCQIIGYDWRFIYLNQTAELHNRRANRELLGRRYTEIWPGIEHNRVFKIIKQALEERVTHHFENEFTFPDGTSGWFDLSIQPVPEGVFILSIDITERKTAEHSLRESEEKYRLIADNSDDWIYWIKPDGQIHYVSPACERVTGYAPEAFASHPELVHEIVFKSDSEQVRRHTDHSRPDEQPHNLEFRIVTKDGELRWVSHSCSPIFGMNGAYLGRRVTNRNITDRKNAENEIRRLNERIATATKSSRVGIWDWDVQKNILNWDDQMYALYGLKKDEFTGAFEAWLNGLHPDDRDFCLQEVTLALHGDKTYDIEFRVIWPDGTIRHIKARGEVFRDETGEPLRMIGVNFDITDQKMSDEKIRAKDQEFRKLSANVPDLIFQFTRKPDGTYYVPVASEGIRNIFGCSPEDVVHDFSPIGRVIYPEDAERVIRDIEYSAAHLTYFTCEFRVQIPGREIQWIYSKSTPERLPDGSITWYGFNTDITQQKQVEEILEQRVRERTAELELANRELEAFSYSVSHDLRAPLRHINGYVDLLNERFSDNLPEKARHYLSTVSEASKQMGTLIDELLQFSRTGRQDLDKVTVDMNVLVSEVLDTVKQETRNRSIAWAVQQLPEVSGDYSLLKLVWVNLFDNAVKYTRHKTSAQITVECREEKDKFVFLVRDNGVGFDMKYAHKLFGVFQRLHAQSEFEGTGIGLANVQRIVQKHRGSVWAEAEPDRGATFYFSLPKS